MTHGTKLRLDAWLPMKDRSSAEYGRIAQVIEAVSQHIKREGGQVLKREALVVTKRGKRGGT